MFMLKFSRKIAIGMMCSLCLISVAVSAEPLRIAAMKGPTGMGLARLIEQTQGNEAYDFTIAGTPDEVVSALVKGNLDVATVPANLASVLYAKTDGKVAVAAINTLGVLYLLQRGDDVEKLADLKGREIVTAGKGATPEFVLRYLLRLAGLDPDKDVKITFLSQMTEVAALAQQGKANLIMLPEPFVTASLMKDSSLREALDMTAEWTALSPRGDLVTGVVVVRHDVAKQRGDTLKAFLEDYRQSVQFALDNPDEAAQAIGKLGFVPPPVARESLNRSYLVFYRGDQMKQRLKGYLEVLFQQEPRSVGGVLPDDDFYIMD